MSGKKIWIVEWYDNMTGSWKSFSEFYSRAEAVLCIERYLIANSNERERARSNKEHVYWHDRDIKYRIVSNPVEFTLEEFTNSKRTVILLT